MQSYTFLLANNLLNFLPADYLTFFTIPRRHSH